MSDIFNIDGKVWSFPDPKDGYSGGEGGSSGKDGLSAYEVAVVNGFQGTEAEWLESLKGKDGLDGLDGTNGTNGTDGITYTPTIGTVKTLDAGENATASINVNGTTATLNLGIPKGTKGDTGESGSVWTTPVTAYAGATSVTITNNLASTNIAVEPFNENTSGTPVAITSVSVTNASIMLNFAELIADNNFICKLSTL